jgi:hypothetical protein
MVHQHSPHVLLEREYRPAVDQDKEISLKTTPETPMSSPEQSSETLSRDMLDLVENQNQQAALGLLSASRPRRLEIAAGTWRGPANGS